jgi:hypothetical protein
MTCELIAEDSDSVNSSASLEVLLYFFRRSSIVDLLGETVSSFRYIRGSRGTAAVSERDICLHFQHILICHPPPPSHPLLLLLSLQQRPHLDQLLRLLQLVYPKSPLLGFSEALSTAITKCKEKILHTYFEALTCCSSESVEANCRFNSAISFETTSGQSPALDVSSGAFQLERFKLTANLVVLVLVRKIYLHVFTTFV